MERRHIDFGKFVVFESIGKVGALVSLSLVNPKGDKRDDAGLTMWDLPRISARKWNGTMIHFSEILNGILDEQTEDYG